MRFAVPLALFTATAFVAHTMPARAYPGASVNLVRIDAEGVRPLPDIGRAVEAIEASQRAPQSRTVAQAPTGPATQTPGAAGPAPGAPAANPLPENLTWLLSPSDPLEISFTNPLPNNAAGFLVLRSQAAGGSEATSGPAAGREVERIPFPSPTLFLSDDRQFLSIDPESKLKPGEITTVEFQIGAPVTPETPVRFALAAPAVEMARKQAPCPIPPLASASAATATAGAAGLSAAAIVGIAAAVVGITGLIFFAATSDGDGGRGNVSR
jgi:hypothetical protein